MKKQLLKLGAICFALAIGGNAMAQADPLSATFKMTTAAPEIDGVADDMWAGVEKHDINLEWPGQTISMSAGNATWQACWDATNTYVLITVPDDDFYSATASGAASWLADKPEIYFDVNEVKVEDPAGGPSVADLGHYQFAPAIEEFDGTAAAPTTFTFAVEVDGDEAGYVFEYAIPHASMKDLDAVEFAPADGTMIGFDVTVIDLDEDGSGLNVETGHANWSNDMLTAGESWVDMTFSGDVTYSSDEIGGGTAVKESASRANVLKFTVVTDGVLKFNTNVSDVKVINSIGQVVKTSKDVSGLNKGVYIVTAKTSKGQVVANRFVIK